MKVMALKMLARCISTVHADMQTHPAAFTSEQYCSNLSTTPLDDTIVLQLPAVYPLVYGTNGPES